jgi:hypothetical protein
METWKPAKDWWPVRACVKNVGEHELKGIPDRWRLYRVGGLTGREGRASPPASWGLIGHAPQRVQPARRGRAGPSISEVMVNGPDEVHLE